MAGNVFAVRDELDSREHVPGGWRRDMVATVLWRSRHLRPRSRRGGCPCRGHVAIAGWASAGEYGPRSGLRCRRSTAPEADSVYLPSTAFRSLDGPPRLEPIRETGLFTALRGCVGNGVRHCDHDRNRVPSGCARRYSGDTASGGRNLRSLRSGSRRSADCGWLVSIAAAAKTTRLSGLVGLVKAGARPVRSDSHVVSCGCRSPILESRAVRMTFGCGRILN